MFSKGVNSVAGYGLVFSGVDGWNSGLCEILRGRIEAPTPLPLTLSSSAALLPPMSSTWSINPDDSCSFVSADNGSITKA